MTSVLITYLVSGLQDADNIEEPVGEGENKDEHRHQRSENEYPGHGGLGLPANMRLNKLMQ